MTKRLKPMFWAIACALVGTMLCFALSRSPKIMGMSALKDEEWAALTAEAVEEGSFVLRWQENELYRQTDGSFILPQNIDDSEWTGNIACTDEGLVRPKLYVRYSQWRNKLQTIAEGERLCIAVKGSDGVCLVYVDPTGLPLLVLEGDVLAPNREETPDVVTDTGSGRMTLYDPGDSCRVTHSLMEYRLRGHSTYWANKPNYRMHLVNSQGTSLKASLLDLRSDDDWLLYSFCSDPARLREMSASRLWNELAERYEWDLPCIEMRYVEVILNNEYAGIYGLAQPVDRKSLQLENSGSLFKWKMGHLPEKEEFARLGAESLTDPEEELVSVLWPKEDSLVNWQPLLKYADTFLYENGADWEEVTSQINLNNQLDAAMFQQCFCFTDNFLNNRVYAQKKENDCFYRIPWDMDLSLGDAGAQFEEVKLKTMCLPDHELNVLYSIDPEKTKQLCAQRWSELRAEFFSKEHIWEIIENNHSILQQSGALAREYQKWGELGKANNIEYTTVEYDKLEKFIRERLEVLDTYYADFSPAKTIWQFGSWVSRPS